MAERVKDWQTRYNDLMMRAQKQPFTWFDHDCVTFAAKALDALYDINLMEYIEANLRYYDEESAVEVIEEYGGLEALVTEVLGVKPMSPALLTTGDVALYQYDQPNFPYALAVHDGHNLLMPGAKGITFLRLDRALMGWRP